MRTVVLLTVSNVFMTFAWYGHLRFKEKALWQVVLVSWGIALVEYVFQVPANRIGSQTGWSGFQLKVAQEAITLIVFSVFAVVYLRERLQWNYIAAFIMLMGAVILTFGFRRT